MKKRMLSILLCAVLLTALCAVSASANSAQKHWKGTTALGAVVRDEECPLQVEHERLVFDISQFPQSHYSAEDDFLSYSGGVTAEYTFVNPSDYSVTATLLFPFGKMPDYSPWRWEDQSVENPDTQRYGVTVNGQTVETKLRHSFCRYYDDFEVENDLNLLFDQYRPDGFYSPDLPMTEYTYTVTGASESEAALTFTSRLFSDETRTRLFSPETCGMNGNTETGINVEVYPREDHTFRLYVMGEPLPEDPVWHAMWRGEASHPQEPSYTLTTREMTFEEFALLNYPEGSPVTKIDWYNAMLENFKSADSAGGVISAFDFSLDLSGSLLRWYEYELTVGPGETVQNAVTAPLYPDIDGDYEPPVYEYTYLLSPAKTWAAFGSLDIFINTPYFITESSLKGFEPGGEGYSLSLSGLPEEELTFSLSAEKHPKQGTSFGRALLLIKIFIHYILPVILIVLALLAAVFLIRWAIKRKKR